MPFPNGIIGENIPELQTDYWVKPDGEFHKIAQWPRPLSLRAEGRFRHFEGQHDYPIATRYLIHLVATGGTAPTFFPDVDMWAWLDMDLGGDSDFQGETFPKPFLPRCELFLHHTETLEHLQVPGTSLVAQWFNSRGFHSWFYEWSDQGGIKFKPDINTEEKPPDLRVLQNNDFGFTDQSCEVYAVSECYEFPNHPDFDPGFADFNGIDGYISLTNDITQFNLAHVIDVDVRLFSPLDFWPVLGRDNNGGFIGMEGPFFIFGALKVFTAFVADVGRWYNWRVEFEQPDLLKVKLFIDDVEMSSNIISRLNSPFNVLGVWRRTQPQELWAQADFRNLKILNGTAPSTDVVLDMPLLVNALDLGPLANHGTTHNMELPSS